MNVVDARTNRINDMRLVHPDVRADFMLLQHDLERGFRYGEVKRFLRPFETYRHPMRQDYLITQGTTRAKAYESAHQFGLAVDFVPWDNGRFNWPDVSDPCWAYLRQKAHARGFKNDIEWDRAHVEHVRWGRVLEALRGL